MAQGTCGIRQDDKERQKGVSAFKCAKLNIRVSLTYQTKERSRNILECSAQRCPCSTFLVRLRFQQPVVERKEKEFLCWMRTNSMFEVFLSCTHKCSDMTRLVVSHLYARPHSHLSQQQGSSVALGSQHWPCG